MEAVSADQFKINHLRKRIAEVTVKYEDEIANQALVTQALRQDRDEARQLVAQLQQEVETLRPVEVAEDSEE